MSFMSFCSQNVWLRVAQIAITYLHPSEQQLARVQFQSLDRQVYIFIRRSGRAAGADFPIGRDVYNIFVAALLLPSRFPPREDISNAAALTARVLNSQCLHFSGDHASVVKLAVLLVRQMPHGDQQEALELC